MKCSICKMPRHSLKKITCPHGWCTEEKVCNICLSRWKSIMMDHSECEKMAAEQLVGGR